jgi:hypothetical protein
LHTSDRRSRYHLTSMTRGSRAALCVAGAGLVAAWLAAAADRQPVTASDAAEPSQDARLARAEHLAGEIQSQARRLRAHLEAPPQPTLSGRNPFAFEARANREPDADRVRASSIARSLEAAFATTPPDPPPLRLSGIAEEPGTGENSAAPVRTAVLSGYGDVFLAKVGETIASRYEVTAIGADAVELKDLLTGLTIRLGLR